MYQSMNPRMRSDLWSPVCAHGPEVAVCRPTVPPHQGNVSPPLSGALAFLVSLIWLGPAHAQLSDETLVLTGDLPFIFFIDDVEPTTFWKIAANNNGFTIDEDNNTLIPFKIHLGTPTNAFVLGPNGAGSSDGSFQSAVGIGGSPGGTNVNLQIFNNNTATIRLTQTDASVANYNWDIRANEDNYFVRDSTAGTNPLLIEAAAPTASLFVATNGSVGIGTSLPNNTGAASGVGKYFNVRADGGTAATGVCNGVFQGTFGAQNHLVHLNAAANQRIMRLQTSSGFTGFHVLNDSLASYAVANVISMKMSNGNVGLRVQNPAHPLHLASGAHVTAGGVFTNASSRELKQDIAPITSAQARDTVRKLQPVRYRYKNEPDETYIGFIAEDVPELVATNDRKSLAPMDVVAVLTKVVQEQDRLLAEQRDLLAEERITNRRQQKLIERQQSVLSALTRRLTDLEQQLGPSPVTTK